LSPRLPAWREFLFSGIPDHDPPEAASGNSAFEQDEILILFDVQDFDILEGNPSVSMMSRHLHPFKGMMGKSG